MLSEETTLLHDQIDTRRQDERRRQERRQDERRQYDRRRADAWLQPPTDYGDRRQYGRRQHDEQLGTYGVTEPYDRRQSDRRQSNLLGAGAKHSDT